MEEARIIKELSFKAVRSSGAGGQHVNKTASKVELHFKVDKSEALTEAEKKRIKKKLANRITTSGELILQSEVTRSQHKNKEEVVSRFLDLIKESLKRPKPRKKTKPGKVAKEKRLKEKKIQSEKKAGRQNPLQ